MTAERVLLVAMTVMMFAVVGLHRDEPVMAAMAGMAGIFCMLLAIMESRP